MSENTFPSERTPGTHGRGPHYLIKDGSKTWFPTLTAARKAMTNGSSIERACDGKIVAWK